MLTSVSRERGKSRTTALTVTAADVKAAHAVEVAGKAVTAAADAVVKTTEVKGGWATTVAVCVADPAPG